MNNFSLPLLPLPKTFLSFIPLLFGENGLTWVAAFTSQMFSSHRSHLAAITVIISTVTQSTSAPPPPPSAHFPNPAFPTLCGPEGCAGVQMQHSPEMERDSVGFSTPQQQQRATTEQDGYHLHGFHWEEAPKSNLKMLRGCLQTSSLYIKKWYPSTSYQLGWIKLN